MSDIQHLIEKLSEVDMEIVTKPKKGAVNEFVESFIGQTSHAKKRERQRVKILQNKKVMLINAHPIPNSGKELIAIGNLALSTYNTCRVKYEKEAWKNKMIIILNKLKNAMILNEDEDIADDYLFLSNETEEIISKGKGWRRLFG